MYEYKTERIAAEVVSEFLNTQAKDGWECFGAYPDPENYFIVIAHLKRKMGDECRKEKNARTD